jgi:hypothetical protein
MGRETDTLEWKTRDDRSTNKECSGGEIEPVKSRIPMFDYNTSDGEFVRSAWLFYPHRSRAIVDDLGAAIRFCIETIVWLLYS